MSKSRLSIFNQDALSLWLPLLLFVQIVLSALSIKPLNNITLKTNM